MKKKLRVNAKARILHVPKDLVDDGFTGEIDCYTNSYTLVLTKKGSSLVDIADSLQIVLMDIQMRQRAAERGN